jgi:hypothetical protein
VVKVIWGFVSEFLGYDIGSDYMSIASKWLCKDKCAGVNVMTAAVPRGLWLTRNDFIFNN